MTKSAPPAASTYQPNKRLIGQLLAMSSPHIKVPDWQRNYSWTSTNVETFWEDLKRFDRINPGDGPQEYFLGSIVLVSSQDGRNLLLDGQQRLATSAILLSAIRDIVRVYREEAATRIQSRYLSDFDDATNTYVNKITLNTYDNEFFERLILQPRTSGYQEPSPGLPSHNLIKEARTFFDAALVSETIDMNESAAFNRALRIQRVLTDRMSVIEVSSADEDSAAEVFETLNDRGIGLSTPDLLRNLLMRRASSTSRERVVNLWRDVLQFESDNKIKSYLRHFWISSYGDVKTQSLYREIKNTVLEENIDSVDISVSLSESADVYRDIISGVDSDPTAAGRLSEISLLGAGAGIIYPLLLAAKQTLDDEKFLEIIAISESLYVRHSIIMQRENSRLENIFYKAARRIRSKDNFNEIKKDIVDFAPNDEELITAFSRLSISRRDTQRYILRALERDQRQTEELDIALPQRVHVEHIYPQQPREGLAFQNHDRFINRIGNLTLLSARINRSLQNADFATKKDSYAQSEIHLTRQLCAVDDWTTVAIDSRQATMASRVPFVWPMTGPG